MKKFSFPILRKLIALALPQKAAFFFAFVLSLLQSIITAFQPTLYQKTIDEYIVPHNTHGLLFICAIIFTLLIFQTFFGFLGAYLSEKIGQQIIQSMRNYVYQHLSKLKLSFFDNTPVGTAITRTISDIETISDLFSSGLITIVGDIIQIVIILFLMFWMNWKLALISLSVLPILLYAANIFRKGVRDSFNDVRARVAQLNAFLQEHITGMQMVQLFNKEQREYHKFETLNKAHKDANIRSIFYYAVFFPVVEIIVALTFALIIWYGGKGILQGNVQVGQLTAFIMFINLFFRPIRAIADRFNNIQMGMIAAQRIFELVENKSIIEESGDIKNSIQGKIEFSNVWFAYKEDNWVLKDINFILEPGKMLAIVGHTGSGKTSLVSILNRFYTHQKGIITIDDVDINNYELGYLRSEIAMVLQDVFLFSGSILENIQLKNMTITEENILSIAAEIGALDFINQLPGKLQFDVKERGLILSMGQRQLISFIRALAHNPKIIFLDEATSSIDSETEEIIQNAIAKLLHNRTSIVIAHRLSTIKKADTILVLDNGEIVESGTHNQLMDLNNVYANLYQKQLLNKNN